MSETKDTRAGSRLRRRGYLSSVALAAALAGCFGGGGETTPNTTTSRTETTDTTKTAESTTTTSTTTATTTTTPPPADCSSPTDLEKSDLNGGVTLSAGCYRVDIQYQGSYEITDGTLRLKPGVTIQFANNDGLDFLEDARLVAEGSPDAPVRLTGIEDGKGTWRGLRFRNDAETEHRLEGTVLEDAGSERWHGGEQSKAGVYVPGSGATLTVRNTTLRRNANAGLVADGRGPRIDVENTSFVGNDLPVWVHANQAGGLAPSNAFEDNGQSYVLVGVSGARTVLDRDATWSQLAIPYRVTRTIRADASLEIQPGATLVFEDSGDGLAIDEGAQLVAVGTADDPIRFSGSGDSRGVWQGIRFRETGSNQNRLEGVVVENAGGSLWHGGEQSKAGVFVQGDDVVLTVRDTTVRNNANAGLVVGDEGSQVEVDDSTFEANDLPIWVHANHVGNIASTNAIAGNDESYVRVGVSGSRTDLSRESTWVPLGVPYRLTRNLRVRSPLELQPGTTVEFEERTGMRIHGSEFTADALNEDAIVLTGVERKTGFWHGLALDGTTSEDVLLTNVVVEYGGSHRFHGAEHSQANLFLYGDLVDANPDGPALGPAGVEIHRSVIRGSGWHGISKEETAHVEGCSEMTYENNARMNTYDDTDDGRPIPGC